jgi:hypothetical protein
VRRDDVQRDDFPEAIEDAQRLGAVAAADIEEACATEAHAFEQLNAPLEDEITVRGRLAEGDTLRHGRLAPREKPAARASNGTDNRPPALHEKNNWTHGATRF